MRDRMEKFSMLPFGCVSQSSVAVSDNKQSKKTHAEVSLPKGEEGESLSPVKAKNPFGLLPLLRPNISAGIQKLIKAFKGLPQLFSAYEEDDDGDMEMEIGLPTDVQHVAHIGWDGFNNVNIMKKSRERPQELLPLPSLSLSQFEMAMSAQADTPL